MKRLFEILLVEDNLADADLTREAFAEAVYRHRLHVVHDGSDALAYLRGEGDHGGAHHPDLILLDINLPRTDGWEVLRVVRADPALCRIPIVVLTSSSAEDDIRASYSLGANCYIQKPVGLTEFITIVRAIEEYWFAAVRLPSQ